MRRSAILAVALLLATAAAAQAGTNPKVSGTFTYAYSGGLSTVTLGGEATGQGSGTFVGHGTFTFVRDNGVSMSGDLTCVSIRGQDAQMFGVVIGETGTDFTLFGAAVHDSGLPGGQGDMAISFAGPGEPPAKCNLPLAWGALDKLMVPITSGDIEID